jgi:hypothetical protein
MGWREKTHGETVRAAVSVSLVRLERVARNKVTMVKTFDPPHCNDGKAITVQYKGTHVPGTLELGQNTVGVLLEPLAYNYSSISLFSFAVQWQLAIAY